MVSSMSSSANLIQVITSSYSQNNMRAQGSQPQNTTAQGAQEAKGPPPPSKQGSGPDPLGVFDMVDADGNGAISELEYSILTEGIAEVTGTSVAKDFLELDSDGDGLVTGSELRTVLDQAGFAPPPEQVAQAYQQQQPSEMIFQTDDQSMIEQLLAYIQDRGDDFNITA